MDADPIEKGLYDAILVVFGGAAGGVAYASLTEPIGVRFGVSLALIVTVWILSSYMHKRWNLD